MQKKSWLSLPLLGAALLALSSGPNVKAQAAVANGVLTLDQSTTLYQGYGNAPTATDRTLAAGTQWQIAATETLGKTTWYQVGPNQWVTEDPQFNPTSTFAPIHLTQAATIYGSPGDASTKTQRDLPAESDWAVGAQQTVNGDTWYEVGANMWITQAASFNPAVYQDITLAQPTMLYTGYDASRQSTGRTLAMGSTWVVTKTAQVNGATWYQIGDNQWVTMTDSLNPAPDHFDNAVMTITVNSQQGASVYNSYQAGRTQVKELPFGSQWQVTRQAVADDGSLWYQVGGDQWVSANGGITTGAIYPETASLTGVPLIAQLPELPNGCEITAVTMMLRYAGADVDKVALAHEMPRSSDPNQGYVGDPWDASGVTIFPPALMGLVQKYAGNAIDMTGMSFDAIRYQIGIRKHPVVAWQTLHGFPYHAVVVTGYTATDVTYLDCWSNSAATVSIADFVSNWQTQNFRAISY
ncbi:secreted SH3 domain protein [Agrilactobacillus composti DSM 18527 = JCM 14202]|uniref:Secreted SH3 domain protein n=1 Tax=Agrilactobacillus composti DSM 18527 = JCM 14202 TaxID=1423734 RepID=X0PEZ8_9LACO|nr:C39 family peptidase [Agrilactobacillus composti]KRM31438.1 secreted SH3 domain protein [Agrilactobacillus composti DSM 18527 = JCM 14202]GAF40389.1 hypothetical protein JCM14202_2285 [Agrilactobacillus composti DSM 18527 = JCM 14202]